MMFLWVILAAFFVSNLESKSLSATAVSKRYCADLPKPLNMSVQACWKKTKQFESRVLRNPNIPNNKPCVVIEETEGFKELGEYLVESFMQMRCHVRDQIKSFTKEDVELVNGIDMLLTEISGNPLICVDFTPSASCDKNPPGDIQTSVFLQVRILESIHTQLGSLYLPTTA